MSVSSVAYTYPCPSLGSEVLNTNISRIQNPTVADICSRYEQLFLSEGEAKSYTKIQNNLFDELGKILPNFPSPKKGSSNFVNFNEIAETYRLLNAEAECKEGAKAYKYYLKEIVSNLNRLTQAINDAREAILKLNKADITSDQAHELITKLEIYDKQAQEAVEAFASYSVCKTITTQRYTFASNYIDNCKFTGSSTYEQVETAYKDLTQPIVSVIEDSVTNLEDLRKLKVANNKCNVTRAVYTIYYTGVEKDEEGKDKIIYGDRYDSNAKVSVQSEDKDIIYEDPTFLALFDELTLLDKVKYIRLYYNPDDDRTATMADITGDETDKSTVYTNQRYVFPEDLKCGFPCIKRETNAGDLNNDPNYYVDDVNETCYLELFYVGYLVNRDGAANALASFMEIKTSAILQQIKLLSYRVKALQYYLKLLNRGFQYLNQADGNKENVPEQARWILQYVGSNTLHTLYQDNGQDKILVQNNGTSGTAKYDCTKFYAIPATDEGVEGFAGNISKNGYNGPLIDLDPPPKALDTQLTAIDRIIKIEGTNIEYNSCNGDENNRLQAFSAWKKSYDTVIKNMESSLEYVNKSIESLRTKVNTFDSSAQSFRTKAYSIFNKLVNHIQ